MKNFWELTYQGRARRLRRLAVNALEQYDLDVARVRLVEAFTNANFRVVTTDGTSYFIRVCMPGWRTDADRVAEVVFLKALHEQTDLGVPVPIAARNGDHVVTSTAAGLSACHCMVFSWLPGVRMGLRLTEDNLHRMGVLFARLHEWSLTFHPPAGFTTHRVDSPYHRGRPQILLTEACRAAFPDGTREIFREAMARDEAAHRTLYSDPVGLRVIHNDLHHDNIKVSRGRLYPLDFEDTCWGYPVQDIATALRDLMVDTPADVYPRLRAAYRQGYESIAPWPERHEAEIDTLAAGILVESANRTAHRAPDELTGEICGLAPMLRGFLDSGRLRKVTS
jgi:Ser/Thr protein kinase RdoA (MazF antagonist)